MIGKSHVVFGIGAYALVGLGLSETTQELIEWSYWTPLAVLGSLFPDLDHHNSRIKRNPLIKLLTIPLTWFGHRTWSHSLTFLLLIASSLYFAPPEYHPGIYAFLIGVASHILGDWFTPAGVMLFWPAKPRFRFLKNFKTGSPAEIFVAFSPIVIALIWVWHSGGIPDFELDLSKIIP